MPSPSVAKTSDHAAGGEARRDGTPDDQADGPDAEDRPRRVTVVTSDECGLILPSLYFDDGSATLAASQMETVRGAAEMFRCMLRTSQVTRWEVIGHADVRERDPLQLSLARSTAVIKALVAYGVAPSTLEPLGLGATQPTDLSGTPAGRARNREVTFLVRMRGAGN